jgi:hypothetical protein
VAVANRASGTFNQPLRNRSGSLATFAAIRRA